MKSLFVTLSLFMSFNALATPVKLYPFKQYANRCSTIMVDGDLNLRTAGTKVTIQSTTQTETFILKSCERFYDSLLCDYFTSNGHKVLTDDFCYDNGDTVLGCLVYNECYYQI